MVTQATPNRLVLSYPDTAQSLRVECDKCKQWIAKSNVIIYILQHGHRITFTNSSRSYCYFYPPLPLSMVLIGVGDSSASRCTVNPICRLETLKRLRPRLGKGRCRGGSEFRQRRCENGKERGGHRARRKGKER
ncbi:hypothetical protein RRG08_053927 [Elysia crispata]|uniref:Uncharacterized protein n=1 Tax=Elysia crispata TaxID=231223 RepID=A0AAE1E7B9_9GAST|nr:hypothetical protein RRG08_053927 [Elysia crispata]